MTVAVWIIAIVEVVRAVQNTIQLLISKNGDRKYKDATDAFIESLHKSDSEFMDDFVERYLMGKEDEK